MRHLIRRFAADQSGVTAIEYGLIAGLIAVVIIGAVRGLGTNVEAKFNAVANALT
jgi:pilus assembly protein Flp/PilA